MRYCPDCGTSHECEAQAQGREDPQVAIARINAERDMAIAKITARQEQQWNESREAIAEIEADTAAEVAVAEAEVLGAILATEGGDGEGDPVIIDAPPVDAGDPEPDAGDLPPVEGSPVPAPVRKSRGLGMW